MVAPTADSSMTEATAASAEPPRRARAELVSIQWLRGIAACSVVVFHIQQTIAGLSTYNLLADWGRAGVDIFFVISGFVITLSEVNRPTGVGSFAIRRLIRVAPLYWGLTLLVWLAAQVLPSMFRHFAGAPLDLLRSLAFIPFDKGGEVAPVLTVGWTLNYEMFFYLLFAVSLTLRSFWRFWNVIPVAIIVALSALGAVLHPGGLLAKFYTSSIALEFTFGCVLAWLFAKRGGQLLSGPVPVVRAVGVLLVVGGTCLIFAAKAFWPGVDRVLAFGLPGLLIAVGFLALDQSRALRGHSFGKLIGDASYSIYLTHPITVQLVDKLGAKLGHSAVATMIVALVALGLAVLVGIAVHLWVEKPVTRFLQRRYGARRGEAASLMAQEPA